MTDLTQALAELRRDGPEDATWTASLVADGNPYQSSLAGAVATTLNAALSGDLIPRADAELAVVLVVEKAADGLLESSVWCDSQERADASWHNGVIDARKHHMAAIRSLSPASALSELQALRDANEQLQVMAAEEQRDRKAAEAELATLRAAEKELSDAYLRIREKLGAWNTAHGGADRFAVTEAAVDALREKVERLTGAATLVLSDLEMAFKPHGAFVELIRRGTGAALRLRAALTEGDAP